MVRTLTQATPLSLDAKRALKISTKSQILHWKRHGTADGVRGFKGHFNNIAAVSRFFKRGGYVTIAIDGVLTTDTIVEACQTENQRHCHRTMAVEGASYGGRVAGGLGGGAAAYGACNVAFGIPSVGTSLLWCGLVAGAAGGAIGGYVGDWALRSSAASIFEATYSLYSQ